jgi:hypothetical protein
MSLNTIADGQQTELLGGTICTIPRCRGAPHKVIYHYVVQPKADAE